MAQAAMALGGGIGAAIIGGTLAVAAQAPEGMRGLIAGIAAALGLILTWRGFGGTRQDARDLFR